MNFADIENTWRSAHNRPSAAELEKLKMKFVHELTRRRRGRRIFLTTVAIVLSVITLMLGAHLVAPGPGSDPVDLQQEWGAVSFLLLPWAGWFLMLRLHRGQQESQLAAAASIRASVEAALDENRAERARTKLIAGLLVTSAGLVPLVVQQLQAVGKAGREILVPAYVVWPTYVVGMLLWLTWRYRSKLMPKRKEMEALLADYRTEG